MNSIKWINRVSDTRSIPIVGKVRSIGLVSFRLIDIYIYIIPKSLQQLIKNKRINKRS